MESRGSIATCCPLSYNALTWCPGYPLSSKHPCQTGRCGRTCLKRVCTWSSLSCYAVYLSPLWQLFDVEDSGVAEGVVYWLRNSTSYICMKWLPPDSWSWHGLRTVHGRWLMPRHRVHPDKWLAWPAKCMLCCVGLILPQCTSLEIVACLLNGESYCTSQGLQLPEASRTSARVCSYFFWVNA